MFKITKTCLSNEQKKIVQMSNKNNSNEPKNSSNEQQMVKKKVQMSKKNV